MTILLAVLEGAGFEALGIDGELWILRSLLCSEGSPAVACWEVVPATAAGVGSFIRQCYESEGS